MKALCYNETLKLETAYPEPAAGTEDVLIAVGLAGICATDLEIVKGYMSFRGVPGHEFVGTVIEGPRKWQGRRVVAEINCVCGRCEMCQRGLANHCRRRTVIGIDGRDGAFAERIAVPERNLHLVPDAVTDEQAVFVEPLAAAFQVIKQCPIEKRMKVAVVGSGRLGLLVAQVLQSAGCDLEVIGRNELTLNFCERRGIRTTPLADVRPRADKDVVVECSGAPDGLELSFRLLRPRGKLVLKSTYAAGAPLNLAPVVVNEFDVQGSRCGPFQDAIGALACRQVDVESLISRQLPLDRGVEGFAMAAEPRHIKILLKIAR
ncbi:MAG TPA: alcohol dehydrogenase catalytic domain-containing protein [Phycisphaerae bacterium]|nr:alcohol dehydrogenase catalytic domain-containing protein [Phycisphaerae bacterium]